MTSEERREARYKRRQERRRRNRQARSDRLGGLEGVFTYRAMFMYGKKCCNGVRWKGSTHNFELHLFSGTAKRRAEAKGLQVNRNKCHVIDLDKPFRFCKAKFQILPSGRIITHGCRDGMKRARRKLRYFRQQVDTGEKIVEQVAEWLKGPIAYYEQFNDHGRVLKLRRLYYALFIKGRKTEEVKPCIGS